MSKTVWVTIYDNKNYKKQPKGIRFEPICKVKCKIDGQFFYKYDKGSCIDLQLVTTYKVIDTCYNAGYTYCQFNYDMYWYTGFIFGHNKMQNTLYNLRLDPAFRYLKAH